MTTSTITWIPVADQLPDADTNVLLGLSSGFTCEGFLDGQVWRDVTAMEIEDAVCAWAEMPLFDSHANTAMADLLVQPTEIETREQPILFQGAMVRAILDGSKTQTRRIVKKMALEWLRPGMYTPEFVAAPENDLCPFGKPGDRLWVRETWAHVGTCDPGLTVYRADYPACVPSQYENVPPAKSIKWKPSIHMFRTDSRITLEITDVRVERLQDISVKDCIAEGIPIGGPENPDGIEKRDYRELWTSINGAGSWQANPWVWCVSFRRINP